MWVIELVVEVGFVYVSVVVIGDLIIDGLCFSVNWNCCWFDVFVCWLVVVGVDLVGVVNFGISGNWLFSDFVCYGMLLVLWFECDVLLCLGVKVVIVLIGINDINFVVMLLCVGFDCDYLYM